MPWTKTYDDDFKDYYELPIQWLMLDIEYIEYLKDMRKTITQDREIFLNHVKTFYKEIKKWEPYMYFLSVREHNIILEHEDLVDFFKEEASDCLKQLRGIEYFLGEITGKNRKEMSKEIAPYADMIYNRLYSYKKLE